MTDFSKPAEVQHCLNVIEAAVNNASANGMYVCINFHSAFQGPLNIAYARQFWNVVAPYFKNRTHVIYEFSNEPVPNATTFYLGDRGNDTKWQAELYNICRSAAPNTFILIMSPPSVEGDFSNNNPFVKGVQKFESLVGSVDWTKTGVGYHTYYMGWDGANNKRLESSVPIRALHRAYPAMPTEISWPAGVVNELNTGTSMDGELYQIQTLERLGVGWWLWAVSHPDNSTEGWYRNWPKAKADAMAKGYFWAKDGITLVPDNEPPTKPGAITVSNITSMGALLNWAASTDNRGVLTYEIYNGSVLLGISNTNSFVIKNANGGTTFNISVKAKDGSANMSVSSNVVTFTTALVDATIKQTDAAPQIDGIKEALWNGNVYNVANLTLGAVSNQSDLSGTWTALWDATNLYIFVRVKDDAITVDSGTSWWDDDRVEVFIDAAFSRTNTYGARQYQYYIRPGENNLKEVKLNAIANTQVAYAAVAGGYNIEMRIPFATLGITPLINAKIGLDLQIGDDDNGGAIDAKLAWFATDDNSWQNPSLLGVAKLGDNTISSNTETLNPSVIISPNPATNKITISNIAPNSTLTISTIDGKLILQELSVNGVAEVDVTLWKRGIYICMIKNEKGLFSKKIILN